MHESDPQKRLAAFDEVKRFVELASKLKSPYIRVFGDKVPPGDTREATIERIIAAMRELGEQAKGSGVSILLESHGDFTDSKSLLQILKGCEMPTTGLLWDAHHTFAFGREQPADTFKLLKKYIRHTHLKDSRPADNGVQYVLTGSGTVPIRDTVRVLVGADIVGITALNGRRRGIRSLKSPRWPFHILRR